MNALLCASSLAGDNGVDLDFVCFNLMLAWCIVCLLVRSWCCVVVCLRLFVWMLVIVFGCLCRLLCNGDGTLCSFMFTWSIVCDLDEVHCVVCVKDGVICSIAHIHGFV